MAENASSSDAKNLFEIRRFDGTGFDLWKDRMQGILFLKDCEDALAENKPEDVSDADWTRMNKKAITYIKMAIVDDILVDVKGLTTAHAVWEKLKSSHENKSPVNQVHLMRKLVNLDLDESKSVSEHLNAFTGVLSQLQDSGLQPFDDKLKAIFLLMTLPESWEALVVSLSNNPNLTYDGVRGSILNEEIRRKSSGSGSNSAYNVRGRDDKRSHNANRQRNRSKSREKQQDVTCFQCGRKGHKKPDCRYFKKEQERKKQANAKGKRNDKDGSSTSKESEPEKAHVASSVVIKELEDNVDTSEFLVASSEPHAMNVEDMHITKKDVIDALLSAHDGMSQSWIVDSGASFHVIGVFCLVHCG